MFNIVDLFCGTGALSFGIKKFDQRFNVVGGIDINQAACETARANHPNGVFLCGSIDRLLPKRFHEHIGFVDVDMIVGGPPCQGFSSLRPNRSSNIDDPRNRLYKHFLRYVAYFEPSVVLMENVIGLLNDSQGELLKDLLREFKRLNYAVEWRVLNAANFGVPQKRERVIFIAVNKARVRRPTIGFPKPTHFFGGRVIGTRFKEQYVINTHLGSPALSVMDAISDLPVIASGEAADCYATPPQNQYQMERRVGTSDTVTLHSAADHSRKMLKVMKLAGTSRNALPRGLVSSGFSSCYSRMHPDEPATTITVKFTSPASSKCIHPTQHRAITPREAARLQGFDDAFVFCGSKTDIAAQIGNAVPPLFGLALAPTLAENLELAS